MLRWEGMVRIPVSKWAQAPQAADPDRVPRDHELDPLLQGSCHPSHCPQVSLNARVHRIEKMHLGPQDASLPSSTHKVWLEQILHNSHFLQRPSTDLAHPHSGSLAGPLLHFSCRQLHQAHGAPDTTVSLRTYLIFSEIDCENSK